MTFTVANRNQVGEFKKNASNLDGPVKKSTQFSMFHLTTYCFMHAKCNVV
jgi:hypothetical protein